MWKDNTWKRALVNLLLALLCVGLVALLLYAIEYTTEENRKIDAELVVISQQQKNELAEARNETVDMVREEYERDMATVEAYLPGIVCWGDSITLGASGNASFPYVLQKYIDTYICDIYDFASTLENTNEYARINWKDYTVSIPVVNMGAGDEYSSTVLGRAGVVPYVTDREFTIPAGTEEVPIKLISANGQKVNPLVGGDAGVNNVTIAGIEGVLSVDPDSGSSKSPAYLFSRLEPGEETVVPKGTEIVSAAKELYRDYLHVVFIGNYGGYKNADDLVEQTRQLLSRQIGNTDRYIVVGVYSIDGNFYSDDKLSAIDSAMMQAFGTHYVNLRAYFCGDGFIDGKITKTKADTVAVSRKGVAPCFRTSADSAQLNTKALTLVGRLIFNRMQSLGYFDEVYSELGIAETTRVILRDNPSYFERMIDNIIK